MTTSAAGRAVGTGLTPTGSGALQICATATFQRQTAAATITQTNVMTAASTGGLGATGSGAGGSASGEHLRRTDQRTERWSQDGLGDMAEAVMFDSRARQEVR